MVASVESVGAHLHLEGPDGRRVRLYEGDLVVGAYGNRYATDFFEGYLPGRGPLHLLTAGGLLGTVASAHARKGEPTRLETIGTLADRTGGALSLDDFQREPDTSSTPRLGTVVVLGSSMNAGKTTTVSAIARGISRAGPRVGAAKVTGSGSGKDHWSYLDAGAHTAVDFLDLGMSSTFGYPLPRLLSGMHRMRDALVADGADVVVMELADGVLQEETRALAERLPGFADRVVLAVADALSAVAGVQLLERLGVGVDMISGRVTASPLAVRETAAATGLPVRAPAELSVGAALELLTEVASAHRLGDQPAGRLDSAAV